jgi:hypothetical protein
MGKIIPWIAVAIAVLFMTKADKPIKSQVRGMRNNNPGNLRPTGAKWAGQVVPGTDPGFMQFKSMPYGIRALFVDLINKHKRGLDTLREILYVYAPPSENRTEVYISNVSSATGIAPTQKFEPTKSNLFKITKAFARVENGPDALLIPDSDWNEGWRLANQRADIKSYVK